LRLILLFLDWIWMTGYGSSHAQVDHHPSLAGTCIAASAVLEWFQAKKLPLPKFGVISMTMVNIFYTWNRDARWAAYNTNDTNILKKKSIPTSPLFLLSDINPQMIHSSNWKKSQHGNLVWFVLLKEQFLSSFHPLQPKSIIFSQEKLDRKF